MNDSAKEKIQILPYTLIVGQEQLKLALEIAYIAPRIGGVLISGHRGTGKSTAARAFAQMMHGSLPVTLPINATEDRVVGGWKINELMNLEAKEQPGLLEEANGTMLYIDEVNLLDDHIINIILDVTSTGVLDIQREGRGDKPKPVSFTLVGTMNPEEGGLRPQLLDRFGLMVSITSETDTTRRRKILQTIFDFDKAQYQRSHGEPALFIEEALEKGEEYKNFIEDAKKRFYEKNEDQSYKIDLPEHIMNICITLADEFQAEGHRSDYIMAMAARASAALSDDKEVTVDHLKNVAPLTLQHRRLKVSEGGYALWSSEDEKRMMEILTNA